IFSRCMLVLGPEPGQERPIGQACSRSKMTLPSCVRSEDEAVENRRRHDEAG
ncbi:hypothetical protein AVEN_145230-1, partial [Araneus ventricosus]